VLNNLAPSGQSFSKLSYAVTRVQCAYCSITKRYTTLAYKRYIFWKFNPAYYLHAIVHSYVIPTFLNITPMQKSAKELEGHG
jgi:hypothetical protein